MRLTLHPLVMPAQGGIHKHECQPGYDWVSMGSRLRGNDDGGGV